jgi:hypothetical protein
MTEETQQLALSAVSPHVSIDEPFLQWKEEFAKAIALTDPDRAATLQASVEEARSLGKKLAQCRQAATPPLEGDVVLRWQEFGERITAAYQRSIASVIEIGHLLGEAKASLTHGEFKKLFSERAVPFSPRTAQRFMQIARHPVLANATHVSHLPTDWGLVAQLASLNADQLREGFDKGLIHPDMRRADLARLKGGDGFRHPRQQHPTRSSPSPFNRGAAQRPRERTLPFAPATTARALEQLLQTDPHREGAEVIQQAIAVLKAIATLAGDDSDVG